MFRHSDVSDSYKGPRRSGQPQQIICVLYNLCDQLLSATEIINTVIDCKYVILQDVPNSFKNINYLFLLFDFYDVVGLHGVSLSGGHIIC